MPFESSFFHSKEFRSFIDDPNLSAEQKKFAENLKEAFKGYEKARGAFHNLGSEVEATTKIFNRFGTAAGRFTHGFEAVLGHARGSGSQLLLLFDKLSESEQGWAKRAKEHTDHLAQQKTLMGKIAGALAFRKYALAEEFKFQKLQLDHTIALARWQGEILNIQKELLPLTALWGETVGQVLDKSYKLQHQFLDISLSFSDSVKLTDKLLSAIGSSRGLVNLDQAAEAMKSLRSYSLDLAKDKGIIGTVSQLHAVTGMSLDSISQLVYRFHTLGQDSPKDISKLADTFTTFARNSSLGAEGVAKLVSTMDELVLTVPKEMQQNLITQVLTLGDVLKRAGLNADALVSSLQETQNIFSKEGVLRAALIGRTTGIPVRDILSGRANLADVGMGQMQFMMQRMQARGANVSATSQAELMMQVFPGFGDRKQWIAASKLTKERIELLKEEAAQQTTLNNELEKITSGPLNTLANLLTALSRSFMTVGTNIIGTINGIIGTFNEKFPGFKVVLDQFLFFFTDSTQGGFQWGVKEITKAIIILTPAITVKFVQGLWYLKDVAIALTGTFFRLAEAMMEANRQALATMRNLPGAPGVPPGAPGAPGAPRVPGAPGVGGKWGAVLGKGPAAKIAGKIGGKLGVKELGELGAKGVSSWIPGLGEVVSMVWAMGDIFQILQSDENPLTKIIKSGLKLVGGLVGGATPIGFAISSAIDLFVGAIGDNTEAQKKANEQKEKEEREKTKGVLAGKTTGGGLPRRVGDIYSSAGYGGMEGGRGGGRPTPVAPGQGLYAPPGGEARTPTTPGTPGGAPGTPGAPPSPGPATSPGPAPGTVRGPWWGDNDPKFGNPPAGWSTGQVINFPSSIAGLRTTYYGYAGDSSPDTNSAHGIGAFPETSRPYSLVPNYDVALKEYDAFRALGLTSATKGKEFTAADRTWRWGDISGTPGAFDIYQPAHASDSGGGPQANQGPTGGGVTTAATAATTAGTGGGVVTAAPTVGPTGGGVVTAAPTVGATGGGVTTVTPTVGATGGGVTTGALAATTGTGAGNLPGAGGTLATVAQSAVGMQTPSADPNLGCAASVCQILNSQGYNLPSTDSTAQLYQNMLNAGWQQVPLGTPGSVVVAPTQGSNHGHTGIVGADGLIYSNSSKTGKWEGNYTPSSWAAYFGGKGLQIYSFMPTGAGAPGGGTFNPNMVGPQAAGAGVGPGAGGGMRPGATTMGGGIDLTSLLGSALSQVGGGGGRGNFFQRALQTIGHFLTGTLGQRPTTAGPPTVGYAPRAQPAAPRAALVRPPRAQPAVPRATLVKPPTTSPLSPTWNPLQPSPLAPPGAAPGTSPIWSPNRPSPLAPPAKFEPTKFDFSKLKVITGPPIGQPTLPESTPPEGKVYEGRAGSRNERRGKITLNGHTYEFISGGGRGYDPNDPNNNVSKAIESGTWEAVGMNPAKTNDPSSPYMYILQPKGKEDVRRKSYLAIHSLGEAFDTAGCMGIIGGPEVQEQFKKDMDAKIRKEGKPGPPGAVVPGPEVPLDISTDVSQLGNRAIDRELGRRQRSLLRPTRESESPTAVASINRESLDLTASDRNGKAMLSELQLANRMHKERIAYLRQDRFLGRGSLLPSAGDDTFDRLS